ncbi:MAG TPA: biopolymer transporter ExbD [Gammaproteobacteria bacterium]|nr:biopolymer transporter ExbD [Gammaproteobacteria bacterium]
MRKHISAIKTESDEDEINLTPMLDVVFIMLIFFIVTASFIREQGIGGDRPDPNQSTTLTNEDGAILVIIDNNDDIWIDNRVVDIRAVTANVARAYAENPERPAVVQAAPNSTTDMLVSVMDSIYQVSESIALSITTTNN